MDLSKENFEFHDVDVDDKDVQYVSLVIKNPSEDLLLLAINEGPTWITAIKNPSDKLKAAAEKKLAGIEKMVLIGCDPDRDRDTGIKIYGMYPISECKRIALKHIKDTTGYDPENDYGTFKETDNYMTYNPEDAGNGQGVMFQWFKPEEFKF